ncbi:cytochrome P450 [Halosimplex salinum]|uniref:cytochrome P450 n=1 Tax=Halosimplex salinum TaxID=1710538 RepID=UPI000F477CAD|nr:cytochrome P450 [Halosimplex salinum]
MSDSDGSTADESAPPSKSTAPLPPSPPRLPVVGHTHRYAHDPFAFVEWATDRVGDCLLASVLGEGDVCVLAHPDYVEQALVTDRDAFAKSQGFTVAFGESIVTVEGEQWERQHDAMREFFYPGTIRGYAEEMVALTERRVDRWSDGERLSLHEEMQALALENLFGTLFDRELALDGDDDLRRAASNLNEWFDPSSWVLPRWVPTPARRRFARAADTLDAEARRLLAERERAVEATGATDADGGPPGDDLLSTLVALRERGDADLTDDEIVDQVVGFIFAGHDTTALAMTYAWHLLGTHPRIRERFHTELDDVLGSDVDDRDARRNGTDGPTRPSLADVGDLEVTERVVLETLRLYPPVHTIPRVTTRDARIGEYRVPDGTTTHVSVRAIHRDERFYDDPDTFRPSRWRDASPQSKGYAFVPFGAGPRNCLGRRFAMLEATLVLATVGRRYRLDPLGDIELSPQMTTQPADGVPARVVER